MSRRRILRRREFLRRSALTTGALALGTSGQTVAPTPAQAATPAAPAVVKSGGTVVVANYAMNTDLDPGQAPYMDAWMIHQNIYEPLMQLKVQPDGTLGYEAVLAESYGKSADGTVWTFKLRKDVKFHDGTPLDAKAVAFSFERIMNQGSPTYKAVYAELSQAFNAVIAKVEAADELTVRFTLKSPPWPFFQNWLAMARIVSPTAFQKWGPKDFGSHATGTGPFQLAKWDFTAKVCEITKNPNYWQQGYPKLDRIVWRAVVEPATRLAELETGGADLATIIPPEFAERIRNNPKLTLYGVEAALFNQIQFMRGVPPFDNLKLRQAVAHAIDRKALCQVLYGGLWKPAINNRWPTMPGFANYNPYPYDPEKARALLREAGYPSGLEVTLDMPNASSGNPAGQRWGEVIQEQLGRVGFKVKLNVIESASFWNLISTQKKRPGVAYYMTRGAYAGDVVNEWISMWINGTAWADSVVPGLPELQKQLAKTGDPAQQMDIVKEMWKTVDDSLPYVAVAVGMYLFGAQKPLADFNPQSYGEYLSFKKAYFTS